MRSEKAASPLVGEEWLKAELRQRRWDSRQQGQKHEHLPAARFPELDGEPLLAALQQYYGIASDTYVHFTPECFGQQQSSQTPTGDGEVFVGLSYFATAPAGPSETRRFARWIGATRTLGLMTDNVLYHAYQQEWREMFLGCGKRPLQVGLSAGGRETHFSHNPVFRAGAVQLAIKPIFFSMLGTMAARSASHTLCAEFAYQTRAAASPNAWRRLAGTSS